MKENQQVEWKSSWRDDYLRWICGFANAEGGRLIIGRDDRGVAVGVKEARRLLDEIPNKVRDILGIMVDMNLQKVEGKELVEIRVEPYPSPISYKGEYHYRSGSTKQELKGAALERFLMKKRDATGTMHRSPLSTHGPVAPRPCCCSSKGLQRAGAWDGRSYATAGRSCSATWVWSKSTASDAPPACCSPTGPRSM